MRPDLQRAFADRVTDASYEVFKHQLNNQIGMDIEFRVCEMPVFVSDEFRRKLETAAVEIIQQCVRPENLRRSEHTLEPRYSVPHQDAHPLFSVVDFAVTQNADGSFDPKLIELQGFPSLFGYQYLFARNIIDAYHLEGGSPFFGSINDAQYLDLLRKAVYRHHDPSDVALVEIDPHLQKTRPDFLAMERLIGLQTLNIRSIRKVGRNLVYQLNDGTTRPLRRIFNRAIIDELDDMGVELDFSWSDELDVEWAGHPNWYFRISKFLLPYLQHSSVPSTHVVAEVNVHEMDLTNYVLKPLYAFAGKGVNVTPTHEDVNAIPDAERSRWILQEKVRYAPCVYTPHGDNFVEIRVMLLWFPEEPAPLPVMSLARTGRGSLMGARYNTQSWTGSSGCVFVGD